MGEDGDSLVQGFRRLWRKRVSTVKRPESSKTYKYHPLDEEKQEIRLITILPGKFNSPIRVTLKTVRAGVDDNLPKFESLSYAWGADADPVNIFIGEKGHYTLPVTQNLAEALPYLRDEKNKRVFWIDAISVNQRDLEERSSQVKRMSTIYSRAQRVVVWLGPESHDSELAMENIRLAASKVKVDWLLNVMTPTTEETHWSDKKEALPFDIDIFEAMLNFLLRRWFSRLWVWQEIRLASAEAIIMCGRQEMLWKYVRDAVYCMYLKPTPVFDRYVEFRKRVNSVYDLCDGERYLPFDFLIDQTKHCECRDPRDRIFALLSLLDTVQKGIDIEPDYTKTVDEVYEDAMVNYITNCEDLHLLTSIEMQEPFERERSWVPDWSVPRVTNQLAHIYASGLSQTPEVLHDNGILQVTGVIVGTIEIVEASNFPEIESVDRNQGIDNLKRVAPSLGVNLPYELANSDFKQFCRVVCANNFCDGYTPSNPTYLSIEASEVVLRDCLQNEFDNFQDSWGDDHQKFSDVVAHFCWGRSFFRTKEGQLGLAPMSTKPGDVVVVLLGCRAAMILRPTPEGKFQVVGEAYCDGVMDGESLLGPFPGKWMPIMRFEDSSGSYHWGYVDRESGKVQGEDPRLGELPPEWRKEPHDSDGYWNWIINNETGLDMVNNDPRLSEDALLARGVAMRKFDLV